MDGYRSDEDIFSPSTYNKQAEIHSPINEGLMSQKIDTIRSLLSGIPPPPEKTNPDYNLMNVLAKYENGKNDFLWLQGNRGDERSLGVFLNLDDSCEEWERLLQKFASRYVSNETFSYTSRTVFMSESAKKRKNGWNSSPRTRISYLSKRRKTFQVVNSSRNTILVDESSSKLPKRSLFTGSDEKCETPLSGRSFPRVKSETTIFKKFQTAEKKRCSRSLFETNDPQILTKQHKQKLLWAVSMALRERGMTSEDLNFKEEASKLFASTRSSWLNRKGEETKSSTSDRMLEFAREIAEELNIGTTVKENKSPRKRPREEYENNFSPKSHLSLNVLRISPQKKRAKTVTPTNL